jgi:hypothetical protein
MQNEAQEVARRLAVLLASTVELPEQGVCPECQRVDGQHPPWCSQYTHATTPAQKRAALAARPVPDDKLREALLEVKRAAYSTENLSTAQLKVGNIVDAALRKEGA